MIIVAVAVAVWRMLTPGEIAFPALEACRPENVITEVDSFVCSLPVGRVAFTAPTELQLHKPVTIVAAVDLRGSDSSLIKSVEAIQNDRTIPIQGNALAVTPFMGAVLQGQGFEITPAAADPRRQPIRGGSETTWAWQVTPQRRGPQLLELTMLAYLALSDRPESSPFIVLRRQVTVKVSAGDWISFWTKWAAERWPVFAGLGALGTGLTLFRKRRQAPRATKRR